MRRTEEQNEEEETTHKKEFLQPNLELVTILPSLTSYLETADHHVSEITQHTTR